MHFRLDTLWVVFPLPSSYLLFVTLDLKDAYFAIYIQLQALTEQIYEWAASWGIFLSAARVQGVSNVTADMASRVSNMGSE